MDALVGSENCVLPFGKQLMWDGLARAIGFGSLEFRHVLLSGLSFRCITVPRALIGVRKITVCSSAELRKNWFMLIPGLTGRYQL
jgi:hypothetical protein